jgi:DNA-directed RNA polymerase specialized sigma24 family protein
MNSEEYGIAYERGFKSTVRFIAKEGICWLDAEETAQQAWVTGWEYREQLRNPGVVRTWVNRIAINLFLTQRRRSPCWVSLPDNLPVGLISIDRIAVNEVLMRCEPFERRLLRDLYIEGLSLKEIAVLEHTTISAVKIRLYRARVGARVMSKVE